MSAENLLPLGDWTENLLGQLGVTKEFYVAAKEACGLAPECGCCGRQETLNEWGRRVSDWWRGGPK